MTLIRILANETGNIWEVSHPQRKKAPREITQRMEYTLIGDNVNLAQRINMQTDRGQILISQSTYEAVANSVIATSLPPTPVKGKTKPVAVWLLHGLKGEKLTEDS